MTMKNNLLLLLSLLPAALVAAPAVPGLAVGAKAPDFTLKNAAGADVSLIGQFGVGFYASFMAASDVTVITRKAGEDTATLWHSTGDGTFGVADAHRDAPGTTIKLKLREADLTKHLGEATTAEKPVDKAEAAARATQKYKFTPAARPKEPEEKDQEKEREKMRALREAGEIVSPDDYELNQAVAFLKSRGVAKP